MPRERRGEEGMAGEQRCSQSISRAVMPVGVKSAPQAGSPMAGEARLAWQPGRSCEIPSSWGARAYCPQKLPFRRSGEALWGCCLMVEVVHRQGCSGCSGSSWQGRWSLLLTSWSCQYFQCTWLCREERKLERGRTQNAPKSLQSNIAQDAGWILYDMLREEPKKSFLLQ